MAKKRALTKEQADELFAYIRSGHSYKDAGKKWGVTQQTAGRYYREVLHERSREAQVNGGIRIVAKRNDTDRLQFSVEDGYMAFASVGGVEDVFAMKAKDDAEATEKFDQWLEGIAEERDAYERAYQRAMSTDEDRISELKEENKRLKEDNACLKLLIDQAEAMKAELSQKVEELESKPQLEVEGYRLPQTVYVIVTEKPCVKGYGYYVDMDKACEEVSRLNEVAKMLGSDGAFDVHEVELREDEVA